MPTFEEAVREAVSKMGLDGMRQMIKETNSLTKEDILAQDKEIKEEEKRCV